MGVERWCYLKYSLVQSLGTSPWSASPGSLGGGMAAVTCRVSSHIFAPSPALGCPPTLTVGCSRLHSSHCKADGPPLPPFPREAEKPAGKPAWLSTPDRSLTASEELVLGECDVIADSSLSRAALCTTGLETTPLEFIPGFSHSCLHKPH